MTQHIDSKNLIDFTIRVLQSLGADANSAETTARVIIEANLCGVDSHGVRMLPGIVTLIRNGKVEPAGTIDIVSEKPAVAHLNANRSLGPVVAVHAMETAVGKAKASGVGLVVVKNSTHWGRPAYYPALAARRDCIGICFTNTESNMPIWGSNDLRLGNGPLSIGAPRYDSDPVVLDIAMSQAAWGKVAVYKQLGKKVPTGWGVDKNGRPTDDPDAIMDNGRLQPMGQHKGAGLSLMIDIMTGILSGGLSSADLVAEAKDQPWASAYSQTFIAIDISFFSPLDEFKRRVDSLVSYVKTAEPSEGIKEILVPGERAWRERSVREKQGIPVDDGTMAQLLDLLKETGVELSF